MVFRKEGMRKLTRVSAAGKRQSVDGGQEDNQVSKLRRLPTKCWRRHEQSQGRSDTQSRCEVLKRCHGKKDQSTEVKAFSYISGACATADRLDDWKSWYINSPHQQALI